MIRTLLFSTLFPNGMRPHHGIFVENRLRHLLAGGGVEARVVAPVPWFPFRHAVFGEYGDYAAVPRREIRDGIVVAHPRYFLLPKIGMNLAPHTLAHAGLRAARRLIASGFDFDLIDAHYFYPDGVAAVAMGRALGKPVVITARGTDINLLPRFDAPRRMILRAATDCAAMITVSSALKAAIVSLGGAPEKIEVLRNGVDTGLFFPADRDAARARFGVSRFVVASVGNLIKTKGHQRVIEALARMDDVELLIAGRGPCENEFRALADRLGVAGRVKFLGVLPQSELRWLYSAADALVLASEREGWPNVLLEAMACGTPVIASDVGGVPEIVTAPEAGLVLTAPTSDCIVRTVERLRSTMPERDLTRLYAERFGWAETSRGQLNLFRRLAGACGSPEPCAT